MIPILQRTHKFIQNALESNDYVLSSILGVKTDFVDSKKKKCLTLSANLLRRTHEK